MAAGQQACVELIWRRGSKGLQRGRFLAVQVRPAGVTPRRLARQAGGQLPVRWLLAEWPVGKPDPTKYCGVSRRPRIVASSAGVRLPNSLLPCAWTGRMGPSHPIHQPPT